MNSGLRIDGLSLRDTTVVPTGRRHGAIKMTKIDTQETIDEAQEGIVEDFELFGDWEERYGYIIQLGKKLPDLDSKYRTDANIVRGCQSQVWLHPAFESGIVTFAADSDAMIVRGLIALILRLYSGRTPDEILETAPTFIDRIGMSEHLSMTRSNGLRAMIKQIKLYAAAYKALQPGGPETASGESEKK